MAEWFKALVSGTSHFGGVSSSPLPIFFSHSYETYCYLYYGHIQLVSAAFMFHLDIIVYRQDGQVI